MYEDDFELIDDEFDELDSSFYNNNTSLTSNYSNNSKEGQKVNDKIEKSKNENLNNNKNVDNKKIEPGSNNKAVVPNAGAGNGIDNGNQFKKAGNIANMTKGMNSNDPEEQKQALKNAGKEVIKPIVRKTVQAATGGVVGTDPVTGKLIDKAVDKVAESPEVDKVIDETVEKVKKVKRKIMLPIIIGVVSSFLSIVLMIAVILSPIALAADIVAGIENFFSSLGNFLIGNGWCADEASCQAMYENEYYEKIDSFTNRYKNICNMEWNSELVTATIFYEQMALGVDLNIKEEEQEETVAMLTKYDFKSIGKTKFEDEDEEVEYVTLYNYKNAASKVDGLTDVLYPNLDDENNNNRCKADYLGYKSEVFSYIKKNYDELRKYHSDEDIVEDIMSFANQTFTPVSPGGSVSVSSGLAGSLPNEILQNSILPLGNQGTILTSCFGFYSATNCTGHSGVDLISNVSDPIIYSIADGTVVAANKSGVHCEPDWKAGKACSSCPNASGNYVIVEHTVEANGQTYIFRSKYVHLKSIEADVFNGATIKQGQKIGIMGNTGCSTGTHLHFSIVDGANRNYNPEELLQFYNVSYKSIACEEARRVCGR